MADNERERRLLDAGDVQRGLRDVGAEVAQGRASLFIGRGPDGFCLIAGAAAKGATQVGHGHLVLVGLKEYGLRALRARIDSLLGEAPPAPPIPEGLILQ